MKIVLVNPPEHYSGEKRVSPPIGLAYIAAALEAEGHGVSIIDSPVAKYTLDQTVNKVVQEQPDAVGLTATTHTRFIAADIGRQIKECLDTFVFVGGPHFSATAKDALQQIPSIDVVVRGEGEYTVLELLQRYFTNEPLDKVLGISYRNNRGRIIENPDRPPVDLNSIPMPSWHLLPMDNYRGGLGEYRHGNLSKEEWNMPAAGVMSSRGCPFQCIFCATSASSRGAKPFRMLDPTKFVDNIELLYRKHGTRLFHFWDDTFTISKGHVVEVCEEILHRHLNIKWYARARVNTVDKEMLAIMRRAGCVALLYGVESGSLKVLNSIKKHITLNQVREAVKLSVELGFDVLLAFMISFPEEREEDVLATLRFVAELRKMGENVAPIALSPTVIYPGTEIEAIALKEGHIFPDGFSWNKPVKFPQNRALLLDDTVPVYVRPDFTFEEIAAYRLQNYIQQGGHQGRARTFRILQRGTQALASVRNLEDVGNLFKIAKAYLFSLGR